MKTSEIAAYCKELRLSTNIVEMSEKITAETHQDFLIQLLKSEILHREYSRKDKLLKKANFYCRKKFNDFIFDDVKLPSNITQDYLKNCEFLKTNTNIVMYGNVGTGKTFLSIALGVEACGQGIETRFYRTAALVNKLSESKKNGTLSLLMSQLIKADLLILDEWGYVPLDRTGAQILFEVVSERYEKKSIIINTNIEFSNWVNVFYDEKMTSAIVDRILHHCHLILFPGPSIRMQRSGINQ